jgi:RNA polymerase sigma-70 factor, ECF subfamily
MTATLPRTVNPTRSRDDLIRAYGPGLFRYAYWLCGNRTSAETLVKKTIQLTRRTFDSYPQCQAVRRQLITTLRKEFMQTPLRYCRTAATDDFLLVLGVSVLSLEDTDECEVIVALATITAEFREALMLQILMDCTLDEIGDILNLTHDEVRKGLYRARSKLLGLLYPGGRMRDERLYEM